MTQKTNNYSASENMLDKRNLISTQCIEEQPPEIESNMGIRSAVVLSLGQRSLLRGQKIVVRVDDRTVNLLGELDNIQQFLEVKKVLGSIEINRAVCNGLTIKPPKGSYRRQRNLL